MGIRFFGIPRTDEKHIGTNTYVDALGEADAIPEREVLFRGDPIARGWLREPAILGRASDINHYRIIGCADAALLMTARYSSSPNSNGPIAE
jgi:hypothetical protein